jgi:4-amino-4-deoxy-L-arabinose transferase-like glycosyltransferase
MIRPAGRVCDNAPVQTGAQPTQRRFGLPAAVRRPLARRWVPVVGLFVVALLIRVAWVLWVDREGFVLNDAWLYHTNARSINLGRGFERPMGGPSAQWPPGYSVLLAGAYWLFGIEPLAGELLNAVLGALTVVVLVVLVERVIDRTTAIVAGTILAVMPGPIMWTDLLVSETLFTLLFVVFFLALVHARPTWRWMVVLGVLIGIGGLVRGEGLTWGLLPIVLFWHELPRAELAKRIGVVAVAVLVPWTIRNAVAMDAFVPIATNASITLWTGHNPDATGGQVYPPEEFYDQFPPEAPLRELESAAALRNEAIEYLFTHPLHELELIPLKLIHLNRGDSYALDWVNDGPEGPVIGRIWVERIGVFADAAYYSLLTLTVLGVFLLGRSFWRAPIGRLITCSFVTALVLYGFVYYGNYRYRLPYEPLMIIVAATLLVRLWRWRDASGAGHATSDAPRDSNPAS